MAKYIAQHSRLQECNCSLGYVIEKLHKLTLPGSLTEISSMLFTHNLGEADELFEIHFGANVAKWQKLTRGQQLNLSVWTTVYCQDGMIDGNGNVTYYDKENGGE